MIHESLRLYANQDSYIIEPSFFDPTVLSENLVISRDSGIIRRNVPALPTVQQETVMTIYGIFGILRLYSGEQLIVITNRERVGTVMDADIWRMTDFKLLPFVKGSQHLTPQQVQSEERYLNAVQYVLSTDLFYFSYKLDITRRLMDQQPSKTAAGVDIPLWQRVDQRFHFNRHLQRKFTDSSLRDSDQDMSGFILPIMSGFFELRPCQLNDKSFVFGLISRRSVLRAGTRYFSRGIDTVGNVSNFVETEQVVMVQDKYYTHVQIRGSIPLFWRQVINVKYQPRLQLLAHPSTEDALRKHFDSLVNTYGTILVWNLVNKSGYERTVGEAMTLQLSNLNPERIKYAHFDFHHECRKMQWHRISKLLDDYQADLKSQSFTVVSASGKVLQKQISVVRTNCMDCLDRTNVVQSEVGKHFLMQKFYSAGILSQKETLTDAVEFMKVFKNIWADHADVISMQYSGTGALKTDFTRTGKRTKMGLVQDGINSVVRYFKNNFMDGPRQDAYDLLLGKYELSIMLREPTQSPHTAFFYVLPAVVLFCSMMIFMTLAFQIGSSTLMHFAHLAFWSTLMILSFQLILKNGNDFVILPILCPPYAETTPDVFQTSVNVDRFSKQK